MTENLHPHSVEAERAILGTAIVYPDTIPTLDIAPTDFWRGDHQRIWSLLLEMRENHEVIDLVTLPIRVLRAKDPNVYGGVAYVIELPEWSSRANVAYHVQIVREDAARRSLMAALNDALEAASAARDDPGEVAERAASALRASAAGSARVGSTTYGDAAGQSEEAAAARSRGEIDEGVEPPLDAFRQYVPTFAPDDLIIIGARPGMGKSALAQLIVEHVARGYRDAGEAREINWHSCEMSARKVTDRSFVMNTTIAPWRFKSGDMTSTEWEQVLAHREWCRTMPVNLFDAGSQSIEDIRGAAYRTDARCRLGLIVVDYLQLLARPKADRPDIAIGMMSRALKQLAGDLKIPIVCLAQLSRSCEKRSPPRPVLSDLRESGDIEQDADVVCLLYRQGYYDESLSEGEREITDLIFAKNRNGSPGQSQVRFVGERFLFEDIDPKPHPRNLDVIRRPKFTEAVQ